MAIIEKILENLLAFRQTWRQLKISGLNKITFFWGTKLQRHWSNFQGSHTSHIERLFYLHIAFLSRITPVPFKLNLDWSGESWCRPTVVPRGGFVLIFIVMVAILFTSRCVLFASLALTQNNLVFMQNGMFTPDALVYFMCGTLFVGAFILFRTSFIRRNELAQVFNSYVAFSEIWESEFFTDYYCHAFNLRLKIMEMFTGKYFGKRVILKLLEQDKRACIIFVELCQVFSWVPVGAAGLVVYFHESPGLLTSHLVDGERSLQVYCAALLTDWTWLTIGMLTGCCNFSVISIPFLGVTLGIRSDRCLVQFNNYYHVPCSISHDNR